MNNTFDVPLHLHGMRTCEAFSSLPFFFFAFFLASKVIADVSFKLDVRRMVGLCESNGVALAYIPVEFACTIGASLNPETFP